MKETKNIIICGVGGQGTLLASKLIGHVCQNGGYDVKLSEVHGMSQRGGSVISYVRYGEAVASPVIDMGEADVILAFELLEAARYLPYLKKSGLMILNDQQINPVPVITGAAGYPSDLAGKLKSHPIDVIDVDALKLAKEAGSAKAVNVVLIGILAKRMEFAKDDWLKAIEETVPEKFREMNLKAFESGFALA